MILQYLILLVSIIFFSLLVVCLIYSGLNQSDSSKSILKSNFEESDYKIHNQKHFDNLIEQYKKLENKLDEEKYNLKCLKAYCSTLENQLDEYRIKIYRYEDYFLYLENLKNYPLLAYSEEGFNLKSQKQS